MGEADAIGGAETITRELGRIVGAEHARAPTASELEDASNAAGLRGRADAFVAPGTPEEVATVVAWCYAHDVAITPRGGGTGFSGGAVPDGGVVLSTGRLARVRSFDPEWWRMEVDAGVTTATVARRAREQGLWFPPDPGAAESSQLGGNLATNAGGPHALKYGVTRNWVLGVEAVLAPGELVRFGGPVRKDVAGYDLSALLIGSEGTLGVITGAWLRLIPAPEATAVAVALYRHAVSAQDALERLLASGVTPAAVEFLDAAAFRAAATTFPVHPVAARLDDATSSGVLLIAEVDGPADGIDAQLAALTEALAGEGLLADATLHELADTRALWRWRDTVSGAVSAQQGGKLSDDIAVPVDRLADAIEGTLEIGARHGLGACSWGHAGDGNLHATFFLDPSDHAQRARADEAASELFALARTLGGTVSGEHGLGLLKNGELSKQWAPAAVAAQLAIKQALDPKGLLNPGKKLP